MLVKGYDLNKRLFLSLSRKPKRYLKAGFSYRIYTQPIDGNSNGTNFLPSLEVLKIVGV
jgi:hypothetical protein